MNNGNETTLLKDVELSKLEVFALRSMLVVVGIVMSIILGISAFILLIILISQMFV